MELLGLWITLGVLGLLVIIFLCFIIGTYNGLIRLRNNVDEGFSTMDVFLKKRYDLIPNLVETVKGYTKHESETLTAVIKARSAAMNAKDTDEKLKNEAALTRTLGKLMRLHEAYPDLKSDKHFMSLQNSLSSLEVEIANARKYYNGCVKAYNIKREIFPSNIFANMFGFKKAPLFEVENIEERKNVKVSF